MTETLDKATEINFGASAKSPATEFNFNVHKPATVFNFGAHNTVVHVIKHYKESIDGQTIECHFCSRVVTDYMDVKNKFCGFCRKSLVFEHRVPAGVKELNFSGNAKKDGITELNFSGHNKVSDGGGITELNHGMRSTKSIPASGGTLVK
jgi:hypothetical protein